MTSRVRLEMALASGRTFGRLTFLEYFGPRKGVSFASFRCSCGVVKQMAFRAVVSGAVQSCGCLTREAVKAANRIHGASGTPEFVAWKSMKRRCDWAKGPRFKDWGGRGITVCPEWRDSFVQFLADVGPKPSRLHSIDRINNDGNYEPGNVRWVTRAEQYATRRNRYRRNEVTA